MPFIIQASEIGRNIAVIAIPFVLWFLGRWVEKRQSTLTLIRTLDREISEHLQRLFLYRRFEHGAAYALSQTPEDPYKAAPDLFFYDSVMVLNFYEAICSEIRAGVLEERILYDSIRNSVIGAAGVVLSRYSAKLGKDQSRNYKNLVAVAREWKARADSYGESGATQIPAP